MAGIKDLNNVWNNVKEIDLRPIAEAAQRPVKIALVGRQHDSLAALAESMRRDPFRPDQITQTPLLVTGLDGAADAARADLIVLLLDPAAEDDQREQELAKGWANSARTVLVIVPPGETEGRDALVQALSTWSNWDKRRVLHGSVEDHRFIIGEFVPAMLKLLPDHVLALARQFPLFRTETAHQIISDTCVSNAAYALSTGIAEIVPILDIPLNIADMFVLTKAQAFLVYRLGLALGLSTRWQDYVAEFGSVLGGGFLWRQVARSLIGLIPAWGIIPKVAVSYAGTYVVGNVIYQWYLTGRHISSHQMRQLYVQAFARGKHLAQNMAIRLPKPRRKKKEQLALPATTITDGRACPSCGKTSAKDAAFCQYCGAKLEA